MAFAQILSLLQQSIGRGSRSTALQPLVVLMCIFSMLLIACFHYHVSLGITVSVMIVAGVVTACYLGCYIFLIRTNVDAARSERFTLEKMAIHHSLTGDDKSGFSNLPDLRKYAGVESGASAILERGTE